MIAMGMFLRAMRIRREPLPPDSTLPRDRDSHAHDVARLPGNQAPKYAAEIWARSGRSGRALQLTRPLRKQYTRVIGLWRSTAVSRRPSSPEDRVEGIAITLVMLADEVSVRALRFADRSVSQLVLDSPDGGAGLA
jgi:hypothetical protein